MAMEFGGDDLPESLDGYEKVTAGSYHFRVTHVEETGGKNGEMIVDMEVQAGTTPNMEGRSHREYFSQPKPDQDKEKRANTVKRMLLFAVACGLTTVEEYETAKKAGKRIVLHFTDAVGRHLCAKLEASEYNGKTSFKAGFNLWPIDSPSAAGIPINRGALAKQNDAAADPFGGAGDIF